MVYVSVTDVKKQTHIEKTTYKCMHCNLNLQQNIKYFSGKCHINIQNIDMNKTVNYGVCKC